MKENRMPPTKCQKPGCGKVTEVFGSAWCADCWYPGIDDDYQRYRAYREDGYGVYESIVMVGWADPCGGEE